MDNRKKELFALLKDTNVYDNFCEDDGDGFFYNEISEELAKQCDYGYGASKFVLIPNEGNFVFKIPFEGSTYESYCSGDGEVEELDDYFETFSGAAVDGVYSWDYCATEEYRYKVAEENGLGFAFAKTEFFDYMGTTEHPVYVQEKCQVFSKKYEYGSSHNSKEEIKKTSDIIATVPSCCCGGHYYGIGINDDWLTDFRLYYGEKMLIKFINFIKAKHWDDDLRTDNIGYRLNGMPVLIDYSGYDS